MVGHIGDTGRIKFGIEAGQHQGARRQSGNDAEQFRRRRNRASGAGGDHRPGGRMAAPVFSLGFENLVTAQRRIDGVFFRQDARPMLGEDGEEFEGDLPMLGIVFAHQPFEAIEAQALGLHLIEKMRQLGGQG